MYLVVPNKISSIVIKSYEKWKNEIFGYRLLKWKKSNEKNSPNHQPLYK